MIDSDSSSEEEIGQEMTMMTLDKMSEPWDCYNNTAAAVCGNIQVSGQIHFEHLPCGDHPDDQADEEDDDEYDEEDDEDEDDDSEIQERRYQAEEDAKQEEIKLEFDNDAAKFDTERKAAEQVDLREVDDEEDETQTMTLQKLTVLGWRTKPS